MEQALKTPALTFEKQEDSVLTSGEYNRQRKRRRQEMAADRTQDVCLSFSTQYRNNLQIPIALFIMYYY